MGKDGTGSADIYKENVKKTRAAIRIHLHAIYFLEKEYISGTWLCNDIITIVSDSEFHLNLFHMKRKNVNGCRVIHDSVVASRLRK